MPDVTEKQNEKKKTEEEHVLHMWEPLSFEVQEGYDYVRRSLIKRLNHLTLRTIAHPLLSLFNRVFLGFRIRGRKNLRLLRHTGAVTICNHVHPMDCTMVDLALSQHQVYYLTLESNFRIPLIRHIIRILGGVPLSGKPGCIKELFAAMGEEMKQGRFVQVYPEGILYPYYPGIRRFKNGAFYLSVMNQVPVLPMVITYRRPTGIYRLYKHKPCMALNILPPVWPDTSAKKQKEVIRLAEECAGIMQEAYTRYSDC